MVVQAAHPLPADLQRALPDLRAKLSELREDLSQLSATHGSDAARTDPSAAARTAKLRAERRHASSLIRCAVLR